MATQAYDYSMVQFEMQVKPIEVYGRYKKNLQLWNDKKKQPANINGACFVT